jgi:hypothetical protein
MDCFQDRKELTSGQGGFAPCQDRLSSLVFCQVGLTGGVNIMSGLIKVTSGPVAIMSCVIDITLKLILYRLG